MNVPARPLGQPVADQRRLMGCVIVHDEMNVQTVWNSGFDLIEKLAELFGAMAPVTLADDPAGCDVEGGKQRCDTVALVVVTTARRRPGRMGSMGWLRSSAWICDFSSTHSTMSRSGGATYRPTTSPTFATK